MTDRHRRPGERHTVCSRAGTMNRASDATRDAQDRARREAHQATLLAEGPRLRHAAALLQWHQQRQPAPSPYTGWMR